MVDGEVDSWLLRANLASCRTVKVAGQQHFNDKTLLLPHLCTNSAWYEIRIAVDLGQVGRLGDCFYVLISSFLQ